MILSDDSAAIIANSLGIETEKTGSQAEFNRQYGEKDIATHNMSMFEYLRYEIKRGIQYIWFFIFQKNETKKKIIHLKKN